MRNEKHDIHNMNSRSLKTIVAMLMMAVGTTTVWGQNCNIVAVPDPTAAYIPTQISNGSFNQEPWMNFEIWEILIENRYGGEMYNDYEVSRAYPHGVDEGWNTSENVVQSGTLFEWLEEGTIEGWSSGACCYDYGIEMNAKNSAVLYQDLSTKGNDVIRWSLKHAARVDYGPYIQSMKVEVGAPEYDGSNIVPASGINQSVNSHIQSSTKATYTSSGISGTYGSHGENLAGLSINQDQNHEWYTVRGVYTVPAGQEVTRFAFIATSSVDWDDPEQVAQLSGGNFLDEIMFSTLIGNMTATYGENNSVIISGYWGEDDADKTLVVNVGNETFHVNMSGVTEQNFTVTIPSSCIGDVSEITFYHVDYQSAERTIVATHPIEASAAPTAGGSITGAGSYTHNATCTLTATPNTGYTFVNWTEGGDVVSTNASYTFTVTGARTLTANFQLNSYAIAATANPTAGGTVAGAGNYNHFASCTLTATPATGYHFVNWTKGGTQVSTNPSYIFTVTETGNYVANFQLNSYEIAATATPTAGGSITGAGDYNHFVSCTLTATPSTGYHFVNWTEGGNVVSTSAEYSFTVTGARTLVANFQLNSYAIAATANPTAGGSINGAGSYNYNTSCTLTATPNTGYYFVNWTEGEAVVSTNASYEYTVTGDRTLMANFDTNAYTLTVIVVDGQSTWGTVTGSNPAAKRFKDHTISATPATDYHFVQWQDGNNDNPRTVTVTEDATYTATFAIDEYRIDSIRLGWQVKIGNEDPIEPTAYVTVNPTAADTMGYVMIPVGSEFVIIPSDGQKPLVSKLELISGSISYATTAVNKTTNDAPFTNPLTLVGDGTVTYSMSGDNICTVNETTGLVTLNDTEGTCTITATVTDGPLYGYTPNTASYTLTVTAE